jgi:hypothetical protein
MEVPAVASFSTDTVARPVIKGLHDSDIVILEARIPEPALWNEALTVGEIQSMDGWMDVFIYPDLSH